MATGKDAAGASPRRSVSRLPAINWSDRDFVADFNAVAMHSNNRRRRHLWRLLRSVLDFLFGLAPPNSWLSTPLLGFMMCFIPWASDPFHRYMGFPFPVAEFDPFGQELLILDGFAFNPAACFIAGTVFALLYTFFIGGRKRWETGAPSSGRKKKARYAPPDEAILP